MKSNPADVEEPLESTKSLGDSEAPDVLRTGTVCEPAVEQKKLKRKAITEQMVFHPFGH